MPTYDMRCTSCEAVQTLRMSMAQRDKLGAWKCPLCGEPMEQVISAPHVPASGTYSFNARG